MGVVRRAELAGERLVDRADVERADLGEAGEHVVAEGLVGQELVHEVLDQRGLEDVAERDPVEELEQRLEGADEQRHLRQGSGAGRGRAGAAGRGGAAEGGPGAAGGGGGVGDGDRTFCEFSMMNSQSWKMREKSALKLSFSFFAF